MIRRYDEGDRAAVLALNAANVPEVGEMDGAKLDLLLAEAVTVDVVEVDDDIVGFMILLGPGGAYPSPNYRWFEAHYDDHLYVARIAIAASARGQGWGPALYARFEERGRERRAPVLTAEVNTVPINERSLRFHAIAGFDEVARCRPYGPDEEVAMLVKTLDQSDSVVDTVA